LRRIQPNKERRKNAEVRDAPEARRPQNSSNHAAIGRIEEWK
jgi:hypothetical protein